MFYSYKQECFVQNRSSVATLFELAKAGFTSSKGQNNPCRKKTCQEAEKTCFPNIYWHTYGFISKFLNTKILLLKNIIYKTNN